MALPPVAVVLPIAAVELHTAQLVVCEMATAESTALPPMAEPPMASSTLPDPPTAVESPTEAEELQAMHWLVVA